VLVFTPRPGRIQKEIRVNLPRPRDINDEAVSAYASQIMVELESKADEKRSS
jgi:NitT/TauT family transport system ATP-binding protein